MRKKYAVSAVLAIEIAMAALPAQAAKNPYELKADKNNKGMVIVEIDDSPIAGALFAKPVDFNLEVTWFDQARKKPHVELHWVSSPNAAEFQQVSDDAGHRYLIGPIGEGDTMIVSYYSQSKWGVCYDAQTYHFFIKGGTYNFIGKYNPYPSQMAIQEAVQAGKMPRYIQQNSYIVPLTGKKVGDDLIPATELPDDKKTIETLLANKLGAPVEVLTPELKTTDYNLAKNAFGSTSCAFWSSKSDLTTAPTDDAMASPDKP